MGELLDSMRKTNRNGRRPALLDILDVLNDEDRADLLAALKTPTIPAAAIREALLKRGHSISLSVIHRYRSGAYDYVIE
jgi:hypothetical protein